METLASFDTESVRTFENGHVHNGHTCEDARGTIPWALRARADPSNDQVEEKNTELGGRENGGAEG